MKIHKIAVDNDDAGVRLDTFVASVLPDISRSYSKKLITDGKVLVNCGKAKPSYCVCEDDVVSVTIEKPKPTKVEAQNIPIDIVYEDDHVIVINKARGMVVHPSAGHEDGTLVNALLFHCGLMPVIGGETRPGIVHRIDKDTTGLLVVAKNDKAHLSLSEQIREKSASRKYKALVEGVIKHDNGEVDAPIARHKSDRKKMAVVLGGREAKTLYKVEQRFAAHTLLDVTLTTGRTHQIRVHMAHIKHPVVGDAVYGYKKQKFNLEGQMLHAYELSFNHPETGERMTFNAPLPEDFVSVLKKIS
jgi:23S rRNA pseudouridine1911/1915/1917 synthase